MIFDAGYWLVAINVQLNFKIKQRTLLQKNTGMETNDENNSKQLHANFGYYNESQGIYNPELNHPSYFDHRFPTCTCGCNHNPYAPKYYYSYSNLPSINSFIRPHYGINVPNTNVRVPLLNSPTNTPHIPILNEYSNTTARNLPSSATADRQLRDDSSSKNYDYDFHDEHEVSTTNYSFTRFTGPKKSNKQISSRIQVILESYNCKTQDTPLWRRLKDSRKLACNACGLHHKKYNEDRPISRCKHGYQTRKRKLNAKNAV